MANNPYLTIYVEHRDCIKSHMATAKKILEDCPDNFASQEIYAAVELVIFGKYLAFLDTPRLSNEQWR